MTNLFPIRVHLGNRAQVHPCGGIQQRKALGRVEHKNGLILCVDNRESRSQRPENGNRCGLVIDENSPLAVYCDVAAQNDLCPRPVDSVFLQHRGYCRIVTLIDSGDRGLIRSVAHYVAIRLFAQQQCEGVDEDRLACASLAGQQV